MNKKGFTLVELITVVVILGILALIVVPNITRLLNSGKNEQMKNDAKELISKAKYYYKMDGKTEFKLGDLWSDTSRTDGYGDKYIDTSSITYDNNDKTFKITLKTEKHCLSSDKDKCSNNVNEENIDSAYVIEVKENEQ